MASSAPSSPSRLEFLTRREVAKILRVSVDGVDAFVHRDKHPLPTRQAGRRFLFAVDEVEAWTIAEAIRAGTRRKPRRRQTGRIV